MTDRREADSPVVPLLVGLFLLALATAVLAVRHLWQPAPVEGNWLAPGFFAVGVALVMHAALRRTEAWISDAKILGGKFTVGGPAAVAIALFVIIKLNYPDPPVQDPVQKEQAFGLTVGVEGSDGTCPVATVKVLSMSSEPIATEPSTDCIVQFELKPALKNKPARVTVEAPKGYKSPKPIVLKLGSLKETGFVLDPIPIVGDAGTVTVDSGAPDRPDTGPQQADASRRRRRVCVYKGTSSLCTCPSRPRPDDNCVSR